MAGKGRCAPAPVPAAGSLTATADGWGGGMPKSTRVSVGRTAEPSPRDWVGATECEPVVGALKALTPGWVAAGEEGREVMLSTTPKNKANSKVQNPKGALKASRSALPTRSKIFSEMA